MITEVCTADRARFYSVIESAPYIGSRIATLYECYENYPALCRFYFVGKNAALALLGNAATIAGEVQETEELGHFLHFCGVQKVESQQFLPPGFLEEHVAVMEWNDSSVCTERKIDRDPSPAEVTRILWETGMYTDGQAFYADFCMRKNRGLARAYTIMQNGQAVATAGIYSLQKREAYLSGVATLAEYRRRGYAAALVSSLAREAECDKVFLTCEVGLRPLYEKAGFVQTGTLTHAKVRNEP